MAYLAGWQTFYVIFGAAAATLAGLMFVGVTLIAEIEIQIETINAGLAAFTTPTVVHFCFVLLAAGLLSAPWGALSSASIALGLAGLGGAAYLIVAAQRARCVPDYRTPLKDWLWYFILPLSAYVAIIACAAALPGHPGTVLFLIAAAMAGLLFLGIHNAWDLVLYLAVDRAHAEKNVKD